MKSVLQTALVALMVTTSLTAIAEPQRGGTLTSVVSPEPVSLMPAIKPSAPNLFVTGNIFDGLIEFDKDLNPKPGLATSWEVSQDGKRVVFHLRKGVKWHDGVPFTGNDVKWTLQNVWQAFNPRTKSVFEAVESVDVPDEQTVVLNLSRPSPAIFSAVNAAGAPILPQHLYEGTDILNNPFNNKPIGTGPYIFKKWERGQYIVLQRNPDYWEAGKPYLDSLVFKVVLDSSSRAALLETGAAQLGTFNPVPLRDTKRLKDQPDLSINTLGYRWSAPWLYSDFNLDNPYLKDGRVRQAIAKAVDRTAMAKIVYYGFAKPADSPIPSYLKFHANDLPRYDVDLSAANALLDEAGFPRKNGGDRFSFVLLVDASFGDEMKTGADFIRQSLKRVGIDVQIEGADTPTFLRRAYAQRDFGMTLLWLSSFADPQIGTRRVYDSASIGKGLPYSNASGYRNARVDELFAGAAAEPDEAKRIELYQQLQRIIQTDLPSLPLLELNNVNIVSKDLNDAFISADQVYGSLKNAWFSVPSNRQ
ncbi:ABC transporter substrate-binding protein [Pseudomonas helleri]|uniref:ABC transporter substrate-binding protein n=1 Tax=Pseudomonas helleri TaxID=1608996 RepID=UPI00333FB6A5